MKRLINNQFTIFDAQIIIYFCFLYKEHRILELTTKARILTEFLIKHDIKIITTNSVIKEIQPKGFGKIISEYCSSKSSMQIIGLKKIPPQDWNIV